MSISVISIPQNAKTKTEKQHKSQAVAIISNKQ